MFHNKYEINEFDVKIFKQSPCYNCANASIESEYGEKKETNSGAAEYRSEKRALCRNRCRKRTTRISRENIEGNAVELSLTK